MKTQWRWLASCLLLAGCIEFRTELDDRRVVKIRHSAPQGHGITGLQSKFGIVIEDSFDDPASLRVYASIDLGGAVRCERDPTPTNTIDRTQTESIFWCPLDRAGLASGEHRIRFWVVDRNDEVAAERKVDFIHDAEPPVLKVAAHKAGAGVKLSWQVSNAADFREVGVYFRGLRVFTAFEHQGEAMLDAALIAGFTSLELRAYDNAINATVLQVAF